MNYATSYQENKSFHMTSFATAALAISPKVTEVKWEAVNGVPYPVVVTSEDLTSEEQSALDVLFTEHDPAPGITQDEQDARIAALAADGEVSRKCAQAVLAVIAGFNKANSLTTEQKLQLITDFTNINTFLRNDMPSDAKTLIAALTPTGVITQQLLDDIMRVFSQHGY